MSDTDPNQPAQASDRPSPPSPAPAPAVSPAPGATAAPRFGKHLWVTVPLVWLLAAMFLWLMLWKMSEREPRRPVVVGPMAFPQSMTGEWGAATEPATQPEADGSLFDLIRPGSTTDELAQQMGGEPMPSEPAGVPPFPASDRARVAGVRQVLDGGVSEMSFWTIPGVSVEQVAAYYQDAARTAGFTPLRPHTTGDIHAAGSATRPAASNQVFFRPLPRGDGDQQFLIVQVQTAPLRTADGLRPAVRVMVLLRYAMPAGDNAAGPTGADSPGPATPPR